MRRPAFCLLALGILLLVSGNASAETRTVSWSPVTTYTDNTLIEAGKTVTYTVYWSTDPGLSVASLHQIASGLTVVSTTFDPDLQGMTRGGTVYFTGQTVLSTGEVSTLSTALSWVVPVVTSPTLSSIAISGAASVNMSSTSSYIATATWSDNTTTAVTPTWSVTPTTYASISSAGLLAATAVSANQTVTVNASYTSGGVTRTASKSVTITYISPTLSSIAISGAASVNEGATATYTATATWSDNTTSAVTPTWSVTPTTYASINSAGLLTAATVTATQTVTVSASYTSGSATRTASQNVSIVNVPPTLSSIAISGAASVNEGATATYTATATWSDNTTSAVTPTWSVTPTTYASISSAGLLAATAVSANQTVTVSASYTLGTVTRTASQNVSIVNVPPTLSSIAISGAASVNEGATATYTATATWSDNTTSAVTPTWSVTPTTYASINSAGLLTAATVTATQTVTVSASYTSGSVTRTASQNVSIVNIPSSSPAAPGNITISGPVSHSPDMWHLAWNPVTTYLSGADLEASRPVRYNAYWTRDPALGSGTLIPLASSISATSIDFSPAAYAMVNNERVYFAAMAVLSDTGDQSPLSTDLSWVVSNRGPDPPVRGLIKKK